MKQPSSAAASRQTLQAAGRPGPTHMGCDAGCCDACDLRCPRCCWLLRRCSLRGARSSASESAGRQADGGAGRGAGSQGGEEQLKVSKPQLAQWAEYSCSGEACRSAFIQNSRRQAGAEEVHVGKLLGAPLTLALLLIIITPAAICIFIVPLSLAARGPAGAPLRALQGGRRGQPAG